MYIDFYILHRKMQSFFSEMQSDHLCRVTFMQSDIQFYIEMETVNSFYLERQIDINLYLKMQTNIYIYIYHYFISGLCIPANNTIFIKSISETLAANEPHLTLEFLEECIQGFGNSNIELKHLCLEYITPWLPNLTR